MESLQSCWLNVPCCFRSIAFCIASMWNKNGICKKFSYRRDSAGRRSLRRSRSFKATYSGTNRKPMCDFVLEGLLSNTYIPSRTICCFVAISLSTRVSLTNSFAETSENIAINHISVKARLFGLHFCRRRYGPIFSHLCNSLPLPQSCRIR